MAVVAVIASPGAGLLLQRRQARCAPAAHRDKQRSLAR
jgi:hypothetical protein